VVAAWDDLRDRLVANEAVEQKARDAGFALRVRDDLDARSGNVPAGNDEVNARMRDIVRPRGCVLAQLEDVDGSKLAGVVCRAGGG
jgi:hypothetical protein